MFRAILACMLAASAGACAINPSSNRSAFAERPGANSFEVRDARLEAGRALVLPVVHDRQTSQASCGAHALASVINYWLGDETATGQAVYSSTPPDNPLGYSMAELVAIAQAEHLLASAVRLPTEPVVGELESGRPVLVPVRLPSLYVRPRHLPLEGVPVVDFIRDTAVDRIGQFSSERGSGLVDHYLVIVGYEGDTFVVVEPVRGYRTISRDRLERYRAPFADAAIVFSAMPEP